MKLNYFIQKSMDSIMLDNQIYKNSSYISNLKNTRAIILEKQNKKINLYSFSYIFVLYIFNLTEINTMTKFKGKKERYGVFNLLGYKTKLKNKIDLNFMWCLLMFWSKFFITKTKLNNNLLVRIPKYTNKKSNSFSLTYFFELTEKEIKEHILFLILSLPLFKCKVNIYFNFQLNKFIENINHIWFLNLPISFFKRKKKKIYKKK